MLVVVIVIAIVLTGCVGLRIERRRRTPVELRGDWWPAFEKEFRQYVRRLEQSGRPRQRHNDHGSLGH